MRTRSAQLILAVIVPMFLFSQETHSEAPKLVHEIKPVYPRAACAKNIKGTAVVEALVDATGVPTKVTPQSGARMFRRSAVQAVKQWRWEPWNTNGRPTPFVTHVQIEYQGVFAEGCGSMLTDKIIDWKPQQP